MRPTERPPAGLEALRDPEVADWIEVRPWCALYFWDADDPRCQRYRARVEVAAAAAGLPVGVLDVRADALVAQALGVKSVPTLVVFRAGEVAERLIGAPPDDVLQQALAQP